MTRQNEDSIRLCRRCGFILGTRPGLRDVDGVCTACINNDKKASIDYESRQKWLTEYIAENKTHDKYDCLIAVSGGKDSTVITKKLFENHGVRKALCVKVADHFTPTKAGIHNLSNLISRYNCDLITVTLNPKESSEHMRNGLAENLNPFKWIEEQIYEIPVEIARNYGIKLVFFGENSDFEYGGAETLEIFHPASTDDLKIIFMGAVYPYSDTSFYNEAKEVGFLDLNHFNEWQRHGHIENYSQIDSIGYPIALWTKFVKFGFQRVSDVACRHVRHGLLSKEQALQLIKDMDYICDPAAKRDFCRANAITEEHFDAMVDKHANTNLVVKDVNGKWRRRDLI